MSAQKLMPFAEAEVICHALGKERLEQIDKDVQKSLKKFHNKRKEKFLQELNTTNVIGETDA